MPLSRKKTNRPKRKTIGRRRMPGGQQFEPDIKVPLRDYYFVSDEKLDEMINAGQYPYKKDITFVNIFNELEKRCQKSEFDDLICQSQYDLFNDAANPQYTIKNAFMGYGKRTYQMNMYGRARYNGNDVAEGMCFPKTVGFASSPSHDYTRALWQMGQIFLLQYYGLIHYKNDWIPNGDYLVRFLPLRNWQLGTPTNEDKWDEQDILQHTATRWRMQEKKIFWPRVGVEVEANYNGRDIAGKIVGVHHNGTFDIKSFDIKSDDEEAVSVDKDLIRAPAGASNNIKNIDSPFFHKDTIKLLDHDKDWWDSCDMTKGGINWHKINDVYSAIFQTDGDRYVPCKLGIASYDFNKLYEYKKDTWDEDANLLKSFYESIIPEYMAKQNFGVYAWNAEWREKRSLKKEQTTIPKREVEYKDDILYIKRFSGNNNPSEVVINMKNFLANSTKIKQALELQRDSLAKTGKDLIKITLPIENRTKFSQRAYDYLFRSLSQAPDSAGNRSQAPDSRRKTKKLNFIGRIVPVEINNLNEWYLEKYTMPNWDLESKNRGMTLLPERPSREKKTVVELDDYTLSPLLDTDDIKTFLPYCQYYDFCNMFYAAKELSKKETKRKKETKEEETKRKKETKEEEAKTKRNTPPEYCRYFYDMEIFYKIFVPKASPEPESPTISRDMVTTKENAPNNGGTKTQRSKKGKRVSTKTKNRKMP